MEACPALFVQHPVSDQPRAALLARAAALAPAIVRALAVEVDAPSEEAAVEPPPVACGD